MKASTGPDKIRTIDVHEDENLVSGLLCSECDEAFPWIVEWLPQYCPLCGHRTPLPKEKSDD